MAIGLDNLFWVELIEPRRFESSFHSSVLPGLVLPNETSTTWFPVVFFLSATGELLDVDTVAAGEAGETYLFVDPKDKRILGEIESLLGKPLERIEYNGEKDVVNTNNSLQKKYNKKIKTRTGERK